MNKSAKNTGLFRGRKDDSALIALLVAVSVLVFGIIVFFGVRYDPFGWFGTNYGKPSQEDIGADPNADGGEGGSGVHGEFDKGTRKEGVYSFLVVGLDNPKNSRNTDVLMLCNFDTNTGETNILQIPRDMYVVDKTLMPEGGKINNLYNRASAQYQREHPDAKDAEVIEAAMKTLCKKISSLFCVPIHHYVSFNTDVYRQMLEIVCPLTIDVPFNMDYDDPTQDLHIHLKKGRQQLTAAQVEGFSRFRQNNSGQSLAEGDFSRVDLQKIALAAIANKVLTTTTAPQASAFVGTIINNLNTTLSFDDCVWFMEKALTLYANGTMSLSSIRMYDLPCRVPSIQECMNILGVDYVVAYGFMEKNQGYTLEILNRAFNLTEDVTITAEMLNYEEMTDMTYCDHSDTKGKSLQEIMDNPPNPSLY